MFDSLMSMFRKRRRMAYIKKLQARGLKLGNNVRIVDDCFLDAAHCYLIQIDDDCTIAPNVSFVAHDASTFTQIGYSKIGKIHVHRRCFIGLGAIILPSVTIGANSIVAAGSVVVKDVEEGTVVAGNPARFVCTTESYIQKIEAEMLASGFRPFGEDYHIGNITPEKKAEVIARAEQGRAFMV